jgi:tetratricopeptide (TPR) repeat protein
VLNHLGLVHWYRGDLKSAASFEEASLPAAEAAGSRDRAGWALGSLGMIRANQGQLEEAIMWLDLGLAAFDEIGDRMGHGLSLFFKGYVQWQRGDAAGATLLVIESQRVSREEVGDMTGDIWPLQLLAEIAREQGRNTEAQALLEQSLTPAQE